MDYEQNPDYLDLDDILAQTQLVQCTFLLDIPDLEFLFPANSEDAKQGVEAVLPYWMAQTLYAQSMIDIALPQNYNLNFRGKLEADSEVVDLHKAGPFYYKFGKLLMELRRDIGNDLPQHIDGQKNKYKRSEGQQLDERDEIAKSLIKAFHNRRHKLIEYSTNPSKSWNHLDVRRFESRLDHMERRLFTLGRHHVEEKEKWDSRAIELISKTMTAQRISKKRRLNNS